MQISTITFVFLLLFCHCLDLCNGEWVSGARKAFLAKTRFLESWDPHALWTDLKELAEDEDLETLVELVYRAGLVDDIAYAAPVTILAPSDDAFENISIAPFLLSYNKDILGDLLLYHVLPRLIPAENLTTEGSCNVTTLNGNDISFESDGSNTLIYSTLPSPAQIEVEDLDLYGSLVHIIDAVLIPSELPPATLAEILATSDFLTELENAVNISGLSGAAKSFSQYGLTLFAPTNDAFEAAATALGIERQEGDEFITSTLQRELGSETFETILRYHMVGYLLDSDSIEYKASFACENWWFFNWICKYATRVTTLSRKHLNFEKVDDELYVLYGADNEEMSKISTANLRTFNGIAHVVETVLLP